METIAYVGDDDGGERNERLRGCSNVTVTGIEPWGKKEMQ